VAVIFGRWRQIGFGGRRNVSPLLILICAVFFLGFCGYGHRTGGRSEGGKEVVKTSETCHEMKEKIVLHNTDGWNPFGTRNQKNRTSQINSAGNRHHTLLLHLLFLPRHRIALQLLWAIPPRPCARRRMDEHKWERNPVALQSRQQNAEGSEDFNKQVTHFENINYNPVHTYHW
jgi:hypothetical protein